MTQIASLILTIYGYVTRKRDNEDSLQMTRHRKQRISDDLISENDLQKTDNGTFDIPDMLEWREVMNNFEEMKKDMIEVKSKLQLENL